MADKFAEKLQKNNETFKKTIKTYIFDIIGVTSVLALMAISLGIVEGRTLSLNELSNIIIDFLPFFFTFVLLGNNFYKKGMYTGKDTEKFISTSKIYSEMVSALTDDEISVIDEFCEEYNEMALIRRQQPLLKRAVVTYELFIEGDVSKDIKPLKLMTNKELINKFGKGRAKWIIKAKNEKVKGVKINVLLGTNNANDITDLGADEATMSKTHARTTGVSYAFTTLLLTFIAVKDVMTWNWFGFIIVAYKSIFVLCKAYMEYFTGYDDATINLVNHTNRKADILRAFRKWYKDKSIEHIVEITETKSVIE